MGWLIVFGVQNMRRIVRQSLFFFGVLALLLCPYAYALGEDDATLPDVVYTEGELRDWCVANGASGGRVALGQTIVLTSHISKDEGNIITIDTGEFGLVYNGGIISTDGFEIIGEGVDVPVVDIYDAGLYYTNWLHAVQGSSVTATGRDGTGGTAICVSGFDNYAVIMDYFIKEGSIRAYGENAVGLRLTGVADIYCLNIQVEGKNSAAVYAEQGANLYYCKLGAVGEGAAAVTGGAVFMDTCVSSPMPQNASVINRKILSVADGAFYYGIKQGAWMFYWDRPKTFILSGNDEYPAIAQSFIVEWAWHPGDVDTSILGEVKIPGSLYAPFCGLGLEDNIAIELIVDVRDENVPFIAAVDFFEHDVTVGAYATLTFWDPYDPGDGNIILWRSDDDGESWYDFTSSPDLVWDGDELTYYYGSVIAPFMLQIEVDGVESNVATIYPMQDTIGGGVGGDRDGGDRKVVQGPQSGLGAAVPEGSPPGGGNAQGGSKSPTGSAIKKESDGSITNEEVLVSSEQAVNNAGKDNSSALIVRESLQEPAPGEELVPSARESIGESGSDTFILDDTAGGQAALESPLALGGEAPDTIAKTQTISLTTIALLTLSSAVLFGAGIAAFIWTRIRLNAKDM